MVTVQELRNFCLHNFDYDLFDHELVKWAEFINQKIQADRKVQELPKVTFNATSKTEYKCSDLEMDCKKKVVYRAGKKIVLSPREYDLLKYFLENKDTILTADHILNAVWRGYANISVVRVYTNELKKKIDKPFPKPLIKCVRGFGYVLEA